MADLLSTTAGAIIGLVTFLNDPGLLASHHQLRAEVGLCEQGRAGRGDP